MFDWAITFLFIALASAALGFGRLLGSANSAAQIISLIAIIGCAVSLYLEIKRRSVIMKDQATLRTDFRSKNSA